PYRRVGRDVGFWPFGRRGRRDGQKNGDNRAKPPKGSSHRQLPSPRPKHSTGAGGGASRSEGDKNCVPAARIGAARRERGPGDRLTPPGTCAKARPGRAPAFRAARTTGKDGCSSGSPTRSAGSPPSARDDP